jgi:transcriptional regulator with XRE-family HTH domain
MSRPALSLPKAMYPNIATYIEKTGDSQASIARVLKIEQAHLSRIVAGLIVPRPELAFRLAAYCKVPLESFTLEYLAHQEAAS